IFNSLRSLPSFNWMLVNVVNIILANGIDFQAFHIPGRYNEVADARSHLRNADVSASHPRAIIASFQPPRPSLGAVP
ncbi:hypothetical protein HD554DRAFT_2012223, partial [Boletus coccyginus]